MAISGKVLGALLALSERGKASWLPSEGRRDSPGDKTVRTGKTSTKRLRYLTTVP